jgi:hypothetical protein
MDVQADDKRDILEGKHTLSMLVKHNNLWRERIDNG